MVKHLEKAGLYLTDQQHSVKVKEFFNDTQIILLNNKAIGALKLAIFSSSLHIRQFQISPKMQGKGVGSRVLEDVINRGLKLKLPITLNVLLVNPAKDLYLRHGFVITSENEFEYQMCYSINNRV